MISFVLVFRRRRRLEPTIGPGAPWTVLNSSGSVYIAYNPVKDSSGSNYAAVDIVKDSSGANYSPI